VERMSKEGNILGFFSYDLADCPKDIKVSAKTEMIELLVIG
jgi:hypothetical protein